MKKGLFIILIIILGYMYPSHAQKKIESSGKHLNFIELGSSFGGRYFDEQTGPNGYKSHNESVTGLSLTYLSEWQLFKRFYAGFGTGYEHLFIGPDYKVETVTMNGMQYEKTVDVPVAAYAFIPIYGQTRYYFRSKPTSGYLLFDIGGFIKLDNHEGKSALKWGIGIGNRYKMASTKYLSWSLDFNEHYIHVKKQEFNEPNPNPRFACLGIKIGMEF